MKKWQLVSLAVLILSLMACVDGTNEEPQVYELNTYLTDNEADLQAVEYEGREFLRDGIGVVTLDRCIDGDTTFFRSASGRAFSVRYLGIDTPESTGRIEPWGQAASDYVCDVLTNAEVIVLQADPNPSVGRTDNNGRQLAYVWYDGRLLNLELIELAYTAAVGAGPLLHGALMSQAQVNARLTGRRIWGEEDPDFDLTIITTSITDIVNDEEFYMGRFLSVEGVIVGYDELQRGFFLSDGENTIYVFQGFQTSSKINIGHLVRLDNVALTYFNNSIQLTNFSPARTEVLDIDVPID